MRRIGSILKWAIVVSIIGVIAAIYLNDHYLNPKIYENQEIVVYARVLPDGSMKIREERTVRFRGEFSRYSLSFPTKGYAAIRDIAVAEQDKAYDLVNTTADRPEGKYTVNSPSAGKGDYKIEWYFKAKDETRKFIIDYRVVDCVTVYQDTAELYWQFIGANRTNAIGKMAVYLTLPPGAVREQIKVWGHGPLEGKVAIEETGKISMVTKNLPANRFLEGRVVFPVSLVAQAGKKVNRIILPDIQKQEAEFVRKTQEEQRNAQLRVLAGVAIPVAGLGLVGWLYWRYGRRCKPEFFGDYYRELPGDYSPAELSILYYLGTNQPAALSATLMDLARRGYIRMEPTLREEKRLGGLLGTATKEDVNIWCIKANDESLRDHEVMLLGFLFNDVGSGSQVVKFSDLEGYGRNYAKPLKQFLDNWFDCVKLAVEQYNFFCADNSGRQLGLTLALVALLIAAVSCANMPKWRELMPGLVITVVAFGWLVAHERKARRTLYGETQYAMWQAFSRFLKDFSNMDRAQLPQLIMWEHYLVFAVALGVAREVLRQLPFVYPQIQEPDSEFGRNWGFNQGYGYHLNGHETHNAAGWTSGLATASLLDSLQETWTSAFSSASAADTGSSSGGDGGGFSSGGGGGGGGSSDSAD